MIREWLLPGLLDTGVVGDGVYAIRDGMVNLFVVKGSDGLVCVDAGWRPVAVAKEFATLGLAPAQVVAVFLTHFHWDHARGTKAFPNARVYVGEGGTTGEAVHDRQEITAAGLPVRVVGTPGHTLGSMSYVVGGRYLFTGDALRLRRGEVVPNYFWLGGDRGAMRQSIGKLDTIDDVECLLTAHCGLTRQVREAFRRTGA